MIRLLRGDALTVLRSLPAESCHMCVTSPPYFQLRDYGVAGQIGLEATPEAYVAKLVEVFREVWRVLRPDATLWLNIGDSMAGSGKGKTGWNGIGDQEVRQGFHDNYHLGRDNQSRARWPAYGKPKDLLLIPFRLAIALQADGWWVRSDICWAKKSCMPESVQGSSWRRHQVTLADYRELFRLRKAEGKQLFVADSEVVCDVLGESASVPTNTGVPGGQGKISEQSEGPGYGESARTATRRQGAAPAVQQFGAGASEPSEVRGNTEGPSTAQACGAEVPRLTTRQGPSANDALAPQVAPRLARAEEGGGHPLAGNATRASGEGSNVGTSASSQTGSARSSAHNGRVARDSQPTSLPMFLLQADTVAVDDGPRDPAEQGWGASEGERGAGMWPLQLEEEQPADDALVDCPGCAKCEPNDGYVLRMSAGRPTSAWEHVFLLSKQRTYFYDAAAVREPHTDYSLLKHGSATVQARAGAWKSDHTGNGHSGLVNGPTRDMTHGANLRNFWLLGPESFSEAHFATFVPEIPRRAILAGTSERGVCPQCGAPWVRVVSKESHSLPVVERTGRVGHNGGPPQQSGWFWTPPTVVEAGWRPSCAHPGEPVPATVLDPFAGAGTTGLVADRLGRNAVLVELNPAYADMAERRIAGESPMFCEIVA